MIKKTLYLFTLTLSLINYAQQKQIDGIVAVVGDEIVLDSDIAELMQYSKAQGFDDTDKCQVLENILMNKVLLYQAKQDTLIQISPEDVEKQVDMQLEQYIARAGSEKVLLEGFGVASMKDLKEQMQREVENNEYSRQKRMSITKDVDVSPYELQEFFEKYKDKLPNVKEEVSLSHIVMYPELTKESKQKVIDKLNAMKKDVEDGISTFENKAIIYSEDPGSASKGGLYQNVKRGKMVKEFDAVAFNLKEGEISSPFETEFGYHIIKLEKRRGQILDLRHILIKTVPNSEEISKTKQKLDSIRNLIKDNKITFKEAALKFSDDKYTRYNSGDIVDQNTGENRTEKLDLSSKELIHISGLKENEMSGVFEDTFNDKKAIRLLRLNQIIPEHQLSLNKDYAKIKKIAENQKENKILEDWIVEQIQGTFISITDDYKDCSFTINWLNDPTFIKKEENILQQ
ncbi:MAG: peptidylprolyl isomerase [Flavobacteriales bacterium]|nr:peptidylprolyl isomerase [Flavobacteriales bacterium]